MNKQAFAQQMQDPLKVLETNLQAESINHVVFFGVHPENDYHILSSIYYYFYSNQISSPEVTYCYYGDEAKLTFEVNWQNIIDNVYPKTVEYAKNITINYLDSKSILKTYF
ncbi:hypothetical protein [Bacillus sp. AFS059628]|uniref:hypothetical protein n=1 Tax=Bacillus sp. AFS059628 TaxID=2033508 RepID=UPI0011553395|nr:hypothetical protein [Bacillus sp. AFS059628]